MHTYYWKQTREPKTNYNQSQKEWFLPYHNDDRVQNSIFLEPVRHNLIDIIMNDVSWRSHPNISLMSFWRLLNLHHKELGFRKPYPHDKDSRIDVVLMSIRRESVRSMSHYCDVIMGTMASQITSLSIVYSTVYSGPDQRKHQSSASLAFVWGIHRWPVNSPHKWPVTRKMFPFDDIIMYSASIRESTLMYTARHLDKVMWKDRVKICGFFLRKRCM